MKEKNPTPIFNVTDNAELEALAKAYVQTAHKRNLSISAAFELISQFWNEESYVSHSMTSSSQIYENEKQEAFRQKTRNFISHFPAFVPYYGRPLSEDVIQLNTEFTVEVICGIHKMFLENRNIMSDELINYIHELLKESSNNPSYYSKARIKFFKEYIFDRLSFICVRMFDYEKFGNQYFRRVDTSYTPVLVLKEIGLVGKLDENVHRLKFAVEPYEKMQKHDVKRTPTLKKVIQLVWIIETFF